MFRPKQHTHAAKPMQVRSTFISYSHADDEFVTKLQQSLDDAGIRTGRDVHHLLAGNAEKQIDRAIRLHETVVLVLSRSSVESDWVEWEASRARELEKKTGRDVLCPVALDESWKSSTWSAALRHQIQRYNVVDFGQWLDDAAFTHQFKKLRNGLLLNYGGLAPKV